MENKPRANGQFAPGKWKGCQLKGKTTCTRQALFSHSLRSGKGFEIRRLIDIALKTGCVERGEAQLLVGEACGAWPGGCWVFCPFLGMIVGMSV